MFHHVQHGALHAGHLLDPTLLGAQPIDGWLPAGGLPTLNLSAERFDLGISRHC